MKPTPLLPPLPPPLARLLRTAAASAAACAALLLAPACSSVESRIRENPEAFAALSPSQRDLVAGGEIREGMPRAAVAIAWGKPDARSLGSRDGTPFEEWTYLIYGSYPVAGYSFSPVCYGDRRFHRPLAYTEYRSVAYPDRSVYFVKGKVAAWKIYSAR